MPIIRHDEPDPARRYVERAPIIDGRIRTDGRFTPGTAGDVWDELGRAVTGWRITDAAGTITAPSTGRRLYWAGYVA